MLEQGRVWSVVARVCIRNRFPPAYPSLLGMERVVVELVRLEAAEEAAKARATLSGKALREHLLKSKDELKVEEEAFRAKAEKDVGASKGTIHTLGNIAKNRMHFIDLCAEWNAGKPGVRKTKLAFERLAASEQHPYTHIMTSCWSNRPYLFEGGLKEACLYQFKLLRKKGLDPDADTGQIQSEINKIGKAVELLNKWAAESQMDIFFPGHGGLRRQQAASQQVREIERRCGGPMDRGQKYKRFPCLRPGWPDELGQQKLDFEIELEAQEKSQELREKEIEERYNTTQSKRSEQAMAAARLNNKAAGREEVQQGGYEGEQAAVFDDIFGDGGQASEEPLSPSLQPRQASPYQEGPREEGGFTEERVEERVDRCFNPEPDKAPVFKRLCSEGVLWEDATTAGGFGQSDDEDEAHVHKKRRAEVYGFGDEDVDLDEAEMTNGYY